MAFNYPEMSTRGWLNDPEKIGLAVFEDYLTCLPSQHQSATVQSLNFDLQQTTNSLDAIPETVQRSLVDAFSNHFSLVDISCRIYKSSDYNTTGLYTLEINAKFTDGGKTYSLGKIVEMSKDKVVNIKEFTR